MTPRNLIAVVTFLALVGGVWAANLLTANFGMIPAGFGLVTTAGTYCAGATFILRDLVQEYGGRAAAILAVVVGAVITAITSSPALALASGLTFLIAEMVDLLVYGKLRSRGYLYALLGSSLVGLAIDSWLFLVLAGFPVTPQAVGGQVLVKLYAVVALGLGAWVLGNRRVVLRERL